MIGLGLLIVTYVLIVSIVDYGRAQIDMRYQSDTQIGFDKRFEIIWSYFDTDDVLNIDEERQGALTRISYVNAATFVINQYDIGAPAEWPKLLPAIFVPRIFWPEKPIISDVGLEIYELATGRRTSSAGAGVFADSYWALGYTGVILFMSIYGIILGLLTNIAAKILRDSSWLYFPVILIAMRIGMRTDGHYLVDVAGGTIVLAGTYLLFRVIEVMFRYVVTFR